MLTGQPELSASSQSSTVYGRVIINSAIVRFIRSRLLVHFPLSKAVNTWAQGFAMWLGSRDQARGCNADMLCFHYHRILFWDPWVQSTPSHSIALRRMSELSIVTSYGTNDSGIGIAILTVRKTFPFTTASRPAVGPNQPPIQRVPDAVSLEVNWPGPQTNHSTPSNAEFKNPWELYLQTAYVFMMWWKMN
jgi:hypothetical protein